MKYETCFFGGIILTGAVWGGEPANLSTTNSTRLVWERIQACSFNLHTFRGFTRKF